MKIKPEHEQNKKIFRVADKHEAADFLVFWLFLLRSFFGHFLRSHGSKNDRSQKSYFYEKSVFSCSLTSWRNFWIFFMLWLYFHDWFLNLYEVIAKFCDLGGRSYLEQKCSPGLYWPNTGWPPESKNLRATLMLALAPCHDINHKILVFLAKKLSKATSWRGKVWNYKLKN